MPWRSHDISGANYSAKTLNISNLCRQDNFLYAPSRLCCYSWSSELLKNISHKLFDREQEKKCIVLTFSPVWPFSPEGPCKTLGHTPQFSNKCEPNPFKLDLFHDVINLIYSRCGYLLRWISFKLVTPALVLVSLCRCSSRHHYYLVTLRLCSHCRHYYRPWSTLFCFTFSLCDKIRRLLRNWFIVK